ATPMVPTDEGNEGTRAIFAAPVVPPAPERGLPPALARSGTAPAEVAGHRRRFRGRFVLPHLLHQRPLQLHQRWPRPEPTALPHFSDSRRTVALIHTWPLDLQSA